MLYTVYEITFNKFPDQFLNSNFCIIICLAFVCKYRVVPFFVALVKFCITLCKIFAKFNDNNNNLLDKQMRHLYAYVVIKEIY